MKVIYFFISLKINIYKIKSFFALIIERRYTLHWVYAPRPCLNLYTNLSISLAAIKTSVVHLGLALQVLWIIETSSKL